MVTETERIAPTVRPDEWAVGTQSWRDLLFLHWPVPVDAVRPLVPAALSLDTWDGHAWISLLPFDMKDVRMAPTPRALGVDALETNVRTYVHLDGRRPGIYFFSLDCQSLLAVLGARASYGLPYYWARMHLQREADGTIDYRMQRRTGLRPRLSVRYRPGPMLGESAPGSPEFWLAERYLLYVERLGMLCSAQVHHRPYPLQSVEVLELNDELVVAGGLPAPAGPPPLAHYSAGVDVEIFRPKRAR